MEEKTTPGPFEALWRYRWVSLLIVVVAVVLSVAVSGLISGRQATASAKIVLATPTAFDPVGVSAPTEPTFDRYVGQRAIFVTSSDVLGAAAKKLADGSTAEQLRTRVTASAMANGEAIIVTAQGSTAQRAASAANAVVAAYEQESAAQVQTAGNATLAAISASRSQLIQSGSSISNAAVISLDQQANSVRIAMAQFGSGVTFANAATSSAAKTTGFSPTTAVIGFVLGLLIAATIAWMRADRDRRVGSSDLVSDLIAAPPLGEVSLRSRTALTGLWRLDIAPSPDHALIVAGLQARVEHGVVLITSATRGEGRTLTALHIAIGAARDGRRVLLVDADPQSSELSDRIGLGGRTAGFATVSSGQASLDEATYAVDLGRGHQMWAVPAGERPLGANHAQSGDLARILSVMKNEYDLVVVDGDAGLGSPQMAVIARNCDGVLLVVRRGTHTDDLARVAQRLELFGAVTLGFVLTGTDERTDLAGASGPEPAADLGATQSTSKRSSG
jgi:Mrp family chromosome partitioning ATPase